MVDNTNAEYLGDGIFKVNEYDLSQYSNNTNTSQYFDSAQFDHYKSETYEVSGDLSASVLLNYLSKKLSKMGVDSSKLNDISNSLQSTFDPAIGGTVGAVYDANADSYSGKFAIKFSLNEDVNVSYDNQGFSYQIYSVEADGTQVLQTTEIIDSPFVDFEITNGQTNEGGTISAASLELDFMVAEVSASNEFLDNQGNQLDTISKSAQIEILGETVTIKNEKEYDVYDAGKHRLNDLFYTEANNAFDSFISANNITDPVLEAGVTQYSYHNLLADYLLTNDTDINTAINAVNTAMQDAINQGNVFDNDAFRTANTVNNTASGALGVVSLEHRLAVDSLQGEANLVGNMVTYYPETGNSVHFFAINSEVVTHLLDKIGLSETQFFEIAPNQYAKQQYLDMGNGNYSYLFRDDNKQLRLTPVDNDVEYTLTLGANSNAVDNSYYQGHDIDPDNPTYIDPQAYVDLMKMDIKINDSNISADEAFGANPTGGISANAVVDDGTTQTEYKGYNGLDVGDALEEVTGNYPSDVVIVNKPVYDGNGNQTGTQMQGSYAKVDTQAIVNGKPYYETDILDDIVSTGEAVTEFLSNHVGDSVRWFSDGDLLNTTISAWFAQNLGSIVDGSLDLDDGIIELAKYVGQQHIGNFVVESVINVTDAYEVLDNALGQHTGKYTPIDADTGAGGDYIPSTFAYAVYEAIGRFAVDAAFNSDGWDSTQYANAGIATTVSVFSQVYAVDVFNYFGADIAKPAPGTFSWDAAGAGGAAAAAATVITSLIDNPDLNSSEWVMLGVQAGIAAGASISGAYLGAKLGTLAFPGVGTVIGAVVGLVAGKIVGSLYKGKKFYEGEFGDKGELLNSIYQIKDIEVDDGNGNVQTVQALVATNANGSTILMQSAADGITYAIGNSGADIIVGTDARDVMSGGGGSDYIEGKDGDETISGGDGNDHLIGNNGDDMIQGDAGDDIIFGDFGNDTILGGDGDDFIHAGGNDTEDSDTGELDDDGNPIFTTLMDSVSGGNGRDTILGGGGTDVIQGDAGDDMIDGGYGNDLLDGGEGNDLMLGNLGNDSITGGDGDDKAFGDEGNDQIVGGNGDDYLNGGIGVDILEGGNGNDLLYGDSDNDFLQGDLGDDDLGGGSGDDTILGGLDNDYLWGQEGDDDLDGGDGDDFIKGGLGTDVLKGASGDDVYILEANDTGIFGNDNITDTEGSNDRIYINGLSSANESNLGLTRDGDNLQISYNAVTIATIANHFVNGTDSIERIEFDTDKLIDLSTVTYDGTTGVGSFISSADANQTTKADIDLRESDINANLTLQSQYWNNGFIQNLSEMAYEEALRDQFENEQYNGGGITEFKRARGKFGGHYKVYKLQQSDTLEGTFELISSEVLTGSYDASEYDEIYNNAEISKITISWDVPDYGIGGYSNLFDIYQNGSVLFTYGETLSSTPDGQFHYTHDFEAGQNVDWWDANGNVVNLTSADRYSMGTITTGTIGVKTIQTGSDHLVGSWWDEVINGGSGDDALFGGNGDDTVTGDGGNDWLFGGDGDDDVDGGVGNDAIFGGDGNDDLTGGTGDDAIFGGDGDDYISGGDGADWIDAGDGADVIIGGAGDDIIYAGGGDDYAEGGEGLDVIYGQGGDDILYGNEGIDYLYGESGNDSLYGVQDEDHLYGGVGDDVIKGDGGDDFIYGGDGYDVIYGGEGADTLDGGDGASDLVAYRHSTAGVTVNLLTGTALGGTAEGDTIINFERIYGSDFDDVLTGDDAYNRLYAFSGDDILNGGAGNDNLYGHYAGADTLNGDAGNDTIYAGLDGDIVDGGDGTDLVSYTYLSDGVTVDMVAGTADSIVGTQDTFTNIERAGGSQGNDVITGDAGANRLYGYQGDDVLNGGDGNDRLYSHAGADILNGGAGNDLLYGHYDGADTLNGGDNDDTLYGGLGGDILDGGNGTDRISYYYVGNGVTIDMVNETVDGIGGGIQDTFTNIERAYGSNYDDTIIGDSNDNRLYGYNGDDTLHGGAGIDYFYSGNGSDFIFGEAGDDLIYGDLGNDVIDGGDGVDTVSYYSSLDNLTINLSSNIATGSSIGTDFITNVEQVLAGEGNDHITGSDNDDILEGYRGNDKLYAGLGNDTLYGGAGDDRLYGYYGGADILSGGSGNDTLYGGLSGSDLRGGDGTDYISYYYVSEGVTIDMVAQTVDGISGGIQDTFQDIERAYGSNYDDVITGDSGHNRLYGYEGDDILYGGGGSDRLYAHAGSDILNGGDSGDLLYGHYAGADILNGDAGNDSLYGGLDGDVLNGGAGIDRISYYYILDGVNIDMNAGTVDGVTGTWTQDTFTSIDYAYGSRGDDTIIGDSANNKLYGYDGDDVIFGGDGIDTITADAGDDIQNGEAGNDNLYGSEGSDTLDGGDGSDYASYTYSTAGVNVDLSNGTASGGYAEGDTLISIERLVGSDHDDVLTGTDGSNYVFTRAGVDTANLLGGNDHGYGWADGDTLDGGDGIDRINYTSLDNTYSLTIDMVTGTAQNAGETIFDSFSNFENVRGSKGDDTITGDSNDNDILGYLGDDVIDGGSGKDDIWGEAGDDIFVFSDLTHSTDSAQDIIQDFVKGEDLIDLTAFSFTSISDFTISQASGDTIIDDNASTFSFKLDGSYTLDDTDFIFV